MRANNDQNKQLPNEIASTFKDKYPTTLADYK
ncbi:hypothetical protein HNQ35_002524 [Cerasibacillus quisquiliarum]|nr:hypothetical protein [Cerasibacillus quisquiliarum]